MAKRYLTPLPLEDRFMLYIVIGDVPEYRPDLDECWLWQGAKVNGYGVIGVDKRSTPAHRVAYELFVGPIPDGLHLDHLCRVRACVNPNHLEPVTPAENQRRGYEASGLDKNCKRGHPKTPENQYKDGTCKICRRAWVESRSAIIAEQSRDCKRRRRARERVERTVPLGHLTDPLI